MITLTIALIAFAIMIAVKKYAPKLPGVLLAVAVTTIIAWLIDFGGSVETGGYGGAIVGVIPEGLPPLVIPGFDFSVMNQIRSWPQHKRAIKIEIVPRSRIRHETNVKATTVSVLWL